MIEVLIICLFKLRNLVNKILELKINHFPLSQRIRDSHFLNYESQCSKLKVAYQVIYLNIL